MLSLKGRIMRILGSKKRFALVATTTAAILVGGGMAAAYWTTSGSGTGSATAGTSVDVTVSQDSTVEDLYPGGPSQALDFTINNPGPATQYISSVSISVASTSNAGCDADDFDVTQPTITPGQLAVGDTAYLSTATGAAISMKNLSTNQDACKGMTINLAYSVV